MFELGCSQGYYSALFREVFNEKAKNVLVEPMLKWWNEFGLTYFKEKNNTFFYNNYIGELHWLHWGGKETDTVKNIKKSTQEISFKNLLKDTKTDYIDLLHMDMQGTELDILQYLQVNHDNYYKQIQYLI
jgi:FkbM family methyltransferase